MDGIAVVLFVTLPINYIQSFCFRCAYQDHAFSCGEKKVLNCTSPTPGRFVFVALRTTGYLTLCEVEVYALTQK